MANRNYEDIRGSDDKRVIFDVDVGRKGALSIVYFDDVQDFSGSEVGNEEVRDGEFDGEIGDEIGGEVLADTEYD
ncbi:hypothetical protein JHK86_018968 [Glycine max]|nr:hypothetical protein JHK86_018968 [Glycine max]